jgi:Ricin-type beta-trefoil lectin domain-like
VPSYTSAPSAACTNFDIWIQSKANDELLNLAAGAGGEHRYLIPVVSPENTDKATEIGLLRSSAAVLGPPESYSRISRNINEARGGDYLYVIWKTSTFDPAPIPSGVYVIHCKATKAVMDLHQGKVEDGTPIRAWPSHPGWASYFNKNWLIEKVKGWNRYTVRNVGSNTFMDLENGSSSNDTKLRGCRANGSSAQEWCIIGTEEAGYRCVEARLAE